MSLLRYGGWFVVYLALAFTLLIPLSLHSDSRLPDDGDAVLGLWIVWWGATHLDRGYPGILDANSYYPHSQGLIYSEPMLSEALLAWPLFNGLDNPVLAANLLTLLTLALSAWSAHLLLFELTGSTVAAFVGALYYGFNAYSFSQIPRVQLITLQWMPLALLSLHRFFSRDKVGYLLGFIVFSVLHGLACFYYLMFYVVVLAILIPSYVWVYRGGKRPRSIVYIVGSGLLMGAVFSLVAYPYVRLYRHYGFVGETGSFDLIKYLLPPADSLLYSSLNARPQMVDHFLGYVALLLAAIGLVAMLRARQGAKLRGVGLGYCLVGLMGCLLSGGAELTMNGTRLAPGPYVFLEMIGPYRNLHDPDRFSTLTTLALSVLVAFGTARLLGARRRSTMIWGGTLLAALVLAEQWSPRRVQGVEIPAGDQIPEAYTWLAAHKRSDVLAELPVLPFRLVRFNTMEAYFSTFHQRPILFNKPSYYPPAMEYLRWKLRRFPDRSSITILQALKIETALVHPKRWGRLRSQQRHLRFLDRWKRELPLIREFGDRDDPLWERYKLGNEQIRLIAPLEDVGSPRPCACREIDRRSLSLDANGINEPDHALDGDRATKWTTGESQRKGHYFEIRFDRPRQPARIEIEMAFPYAEFPRNLEINGYLGQRMWRMERAEDVWYEVALIRQLVDDPSKARLRYDFQSRPVDRLRLFINRTEEAVHAWTIPEIHVYELSEDDSPGGG